MTDRISERWYDVGPTQRLDGEDFFVSYNPDTIQLTGDPIIDSVVAGEMPVETALCRTEASKQLTYILNGDWRQQYEDRVDEGWDRCYTFYLGKKAVHGSSWSSDADE